MSEKRAFRTKLEAQVDLLAAQLDEVKDTITDNEIVESLEERLGDIRSWLDRVKDAGEDQWEHLKDDVEDAFDKLRSGVEDVWDRVKPGDDGDSNEKGA